DAVPPARAPESPARRLPRAWACAATVARLVPAHGGGNRHPPAPLPASLQPPDAAALPCVLRRDADRGPGRAGVGGGRARRGLGHPCPRRVPGRTILPPIASVR